MILKIELIEYYDTLAAGDGPGIIITYTDPNGVQGSKMFRRGKAEELFDDLANSARILELREAAQRRIEASRIASFQSRTRKTTRGPSGPAPSLEDLGL